MPENNSINQLFPLGSVGAGCVGVDHYGNLFNNVLHPLKQGPLLPNTFPVFRADIGDGAPYIRALRRKSGGAPMRQSAHTPPFLNANEYAQQAQYPMLTCQLHDNTAPVRLMWRYFSPLAPYDHVASVMPCILLSVFVTNTSDRAAECSLMFCMDNLAREVSGDETLQPARVQFIRLEPSTNDNRNHMGTNLFRGAIAEAAEEHIESYVRNAVLFGERRNAAPTAFPHLCVAVKEQLDATVSLGVWDPDSPASSEAFWQTFNETGKAAPPHPGDVPRAAAVAATITIAPGASQRFDILFAWHLPPKLYEPRGLANGYMQHFPNAPESIRYGLRHLTYLHAAVINWQKQLTDSGLPRKYVDAIIDSCRAFTTHTRHTPNNGFELLMRYDRPNSPVDDWDFLKAYALLLFMPRFHAAAVASALAAALEQCKDAARISNDAFLGHCGELILSAYADVVFTGNRTRLRDWRPKVIALCDACASCLRDQSAAESNDAALSAETTGLWAAALDAIAAMTKAQGQPVPSKQAKLQQTLAAAYEKRLKNNDTQAQSNNNRATVQDILAIKGACLAEMLQLKPLVSAQSVLVRLSSTAAASDVDAVDAHQQQQARILTAVATLLFSRQTMAEYKHKGRMESFLNGFIEHTSTAPTSTSNNLDLWATLQTLSGVYVDSLQHTLIIRPSALVEPGAPMPVFTPLSLGKMDLQIEEGQDFILIVRVILDTPLTIESIALQLPVAMSGARVTCVHDEEVLAISQELSAGNDDTRIFLRFKSPLKLSGIITLRLRETPPRQ